MAEDLSREPAESGLQDLISRKERGIRKRNRRIFGILSITLLTIALGKLGYPLLSDRKEGYSSVDKAINYVIASEFIAFGAYCFYSATGKRMQDYIDIISTRERIRQ